MLSKPDPNLEKCANLKQIVDLVNEASKQFGTEIDMGYKCKQMMIDVGFADVTEKIVHVSRKNSNNYCV